MLSQPHPHAERMAARARTSDSAVVDVGFTRWGGAATPPLALLCIQWFGWRWAFVGLRGTGACMVRDLPGMVQGRSRADTRPSMMPNREIAGRIARPHDTHQAGTAHWLSLLLTRQVAVTHAAILLLFLRLVLLHHMAADLSARRPRTIAGTRCRARRAATAVRRLRLFVRGIHPDDCRAGPSHFAGLLATAVLLLASPVSNLCFLAMIAMGLASFASDMTMPISWDACVEIGGALHSDGGRSDEHAGQPGWLRRAGSRRQ